MRYRSLLLLLALPAVGVSLAGCTVDGAIDDAERMFDDLTGGDDELGVRVPKDFTLRVQNGYDQQADVDVRIEADADPPHRWFLNVTETFAAGATWSTTTVLHANTAYVVNLTVRDASGALLVRVQETFRAFDCRSDDAMGLRLGLEMDGSEPGQPVYALASTLVCGPP